MILYVNGCSHSTAAEAAELSCTLGMSERYSNITLEMKNERTN